MPIAQAEVLHSAKPSNRFVYRVTLQTDRKSADVYQQLNQFGVQFSSTKTKLQNSKTASFFSFYVQPTRFADLGQVLRSMGTTLTQKKVDYLEGPSELIRISLWTAKKQNTTGLASVVVTQAVNNPSKLKNRSTLMNLFDLSQMTQELLANGPIVLDTDQQLSSSRSFAVRMQFVKREIPIPEKSKDGWDLILEVSPKTVYQLEQAKKILAELPGFQIIEVQSDERYVSRGMMISEKDFLGSLVQRFPHSLIEIYPNADKFGLPQRVLVKFIVPDIHLNALLYPPHEDPKTPQNLVAELPPSPPLTALERRPLKKFFEAHALGSMLFKGSTTMPVIDAFLQGFIENYGMKAQFIQLMNAPEDFAVTSTSASLQYRQPIHDETYKQTMVGSLHYRRIATESITGDFYGMGLSYTDHLWPTFDRWLSQYSFLDYPKTLELNVEYFPASTKSNVQNLTAYALNLRSYMYLSDQLTVEAGIYSHKFQFSVPAGAGMSNNTMFFEFGFGYRF